MKHLTSNIALLVGLLIVKKQIHGEEKQLHQKEIRVLKVFRATLFSQTLSPYHISCCIP